MSISFVAAFSAGLLTAFSPCILPMVPILVAGLVGPSGGSSWARLRATASFTIGFATVFVALGVSVPATVHAFPGLRPVLLGLSAAVLALYGLKMTRVLRPWALFSWMDRSAGLASGSTGEGGVLRSLVLGAIFGFSWTPCAGPILGGVLTYAAASDASALRGGALLLAYAGGVAAPLVFVAVAAERVIPLLRSLLPYTRAIEALAGLALIVVGAQIGAQAIGTGRFSGNVFRGDGLSLESRSTADPADTTSRVLFFHSEHCPTCRAMQQFLPALAEACRSNRWRLVPVDVDRQENRAMVERFQVRAVPTLSLLDERGSEVERLVGFQTSDHLRQAIERTMAVACATDAIPRAEDAGDGGDAACTVGKAC